MGNWSALTRDLLIAIARRLDTAADRARFSGVCRNWSSLAKSEINYLPRHPPWLMLTEKVESDDRDFVGAHGNERFVLELPKSRGSRCIGSNGCWVVMIDAACDMYILNPFSRAKIDLPSMLSLDDFMVDNPEDEDILDLRDYYVDKVILSSTKSQSPGEEDFIAVVIYTPFRKAMKLAYTKKGDKSWQSIESNDNPFLDVIFYQDKFYAVDNTGIIWVFNIHSSPDEKPVMDPISYPLMDNLGYKRHLVEFEGLLLQVLNLDDYYRWHSFKTWGFLVFKMDFTTGGWLELNDLGQHSIFLGYNTGLSLLATPNCTFDPNCIYFSTDEFIKIWVDGKRFDGGDVGVFDLTDSTIEPYYTGPYSGSAFTRPVWIVPTSLNQ